MHPISYCFQVIANYWSNLCIQQEVPVFDTLVLIEPLNSGSRTLALNKTRRIPILYGVDILTDDYFAFSQWMRLTDRRTDRQTDVDSKTVCMHSQSSRTVKSNTSVAILSGPHGGLPNCQQEISAARGAVWPVHASITVYHSPQIIHLHLL